MSKRNEPMEDIVREMRRGFDQSWRDVDREWAHDLADRIEAAYRRERDAYVRDAMGMREALCEHDRLCEMLSAAEGDAERMRKALEFVKDAMETNVLYAPGDSPSYESVEKVRKVYCKVMTALGIEEAKEGGGDDR